MRKSVSATFALAEKYGKKCQVFIYCNIPDTTCGSRHHPGRKTGLKPSASALKKAKNNFSMHQIDACLNTAKPFVIQPMQAYKKFSTAGDTAGMLKSEAKTTTLSISWGIRCHV